MMVYNHTWRYLPAASLYPFSYSALHHDIILARSFVSLVSFAFQPLSARYSSGSSDSAIVRRAVCTLYHKEHERRGARKAACHVVTALRIQSRETIADFGTIASYKGITIENARDSREK